MIESRIKKKKGQRILINILLLIITLTLSMIVFEMFLRLVDPELGIIKDTEHIDDQPDCRSYSIYPELRFVGENKDILLYHSDFSLEYCSNKKEKNVFRIIMIGDSVTEGVKVSPDLIFSKLLEDKLNNLSLNKKFEVFNFAKASYNLQQINYILEHEVLKCEPDMIVYGFYQNDINSYRVKTTQDNVTVSYSLDEIRYLYDFPLNKYFLRKSLVYRFFNMVLVNLLENRGIRPKIKYYSLSYEEAEHLLNNMYYLSKKNNIPLLIINIPMTYNGEEYRTNNFLQIMSEKNNISHFEIKDKFIENNIDPSKLTIDYDHYNEYGHSVVAGILFDYVKDLEPIKDLIR